MEKEKTKNGELKRNSQKTRMAFDAYVVLIIQAAVTHVAAAAEESNREFSKLCKLISRIHSIMVQGFKNVCFSVDHETSLAQTPRVDTKY